MKKLGLLLLIAVAASAYGQTWQLVNPLPAGRADDIAIGYTSPGNQQRLYIADQTSWPFKTTNGGASWDSLYDPPAHQTAQPIAIITDPNNAAHVWIARTGQGVFYSENEGLSWEQRIIGLTNLNLLTLEMAPDDPDVIFAGCRPSGSSNVFKTTDGGATGWLALGEITGQEVHDIETLGAGSNVLLAACGGGIYKSVDGGQSWQLKYAGEAEDIARNPNVTGVFYAVLAGANGVVLETTDDGESWISMGLTGKWFKKVAVSRSSWIFVAAEGNFAFEGGLWWKDPVSGWHKVTSDEGIYDPLGISVLADLNPASPDFVLYSTRTGLYRSADRGASWGQSVSGMRLTHPASFSSSQPGGIFAKAIRFAMAPWVGTDSAMVVYQSTNNGTDWKMLYSCPTYEQGARGSHTLVVHPEDASRIYLVFESGMDYHVFSSSTDGGKHWIGQGMPGSTASMFQALAVDQNLNYAYLLNDYDVRFWRTFNGIQWNPVPGGLDVTNPNCAASFPAPTGTIFVGTGGETPPYHGIFRSQDNGNSWTQVGLAGNKVTSLAIDNLTPSIVIAGVHDGPELGVHKSTDNGGSWLNMSDGITHLPVKSLASDPAEPAVVYAANHSGGPGNWIGHFYVTVDGARQWTEITGTPPFKEIYDLQIDYNQPDKVYAVTTDGNYNFDAQQIPKATGLYTHTPAWQFKSLTSASSNASDYNSQRKLVRQEWTSNLHAVYHSGNASEHNVYYVSSTDGGATWSRKILLGSGMHPAIALDDVGNPQVIWLDDLEQQLRYAYCQGGVWSAAQTIFSVSGSDKIGPPAFCAVPYVVGSRGHVVFNWKSGIGSSTAIKYGWFTLNASGTLQSVANVDNGSNSSSTCLFPSIAYSNGSEGAYLHASWSKGSNVYYSYKQLDTGPWNNTRISQTQVTNAHPNIEFYGGNVNVAWVVTSSPNRIINRFRGFPYGTWSNYLPVSQAAGCASPQMAAGAYCVWNEGDYEVYYAYRVNGVWQPKINLSNTSQCSVSPQVAFMPWMMGTTIFCFWTENDAAPYQEFFTTTIGPLAAFYTVDAGLVDPSPYTVHRGGYLQYTQEPEKTVDTDSSYLSYRFDRLDPKMLYLVRASYYQETGSPAGLEVKVDGAVFANVAVPNRSVLRGEAWLPSELYADSVVEIVIRKKSGTLGTLGYLELCQAEPKGKGGPQSSGLSDLSLPRKFSLGAGYPNPMTSEARVDYALPKTSSVDLTVYNISGQLVRRLKSETNQAPGRYSVRWDGRNESGHRVPGGVYFYRLSAGSFVETKKLVVVR